MSLGDDGSADPADVSIIGVNAAIMFRTKVREVESLSRKEKPRLSETTSS